MDRMIEVNLGGERRYLNFSVEVMFDMEDVFGSLDAAMDLLKQNGREGFEAFQWFFIHMANDAELARRAEGYDPMPMLKADDILTHLHPLEYMELVGAVVNAINAGYTREKAGKDNEVDIGLEELRQKKTRNAEAAGPILTTSDAHFCGCRARSFIGCSRDCLMICGTSIS